MTRVIVCFGLLWLVVHYVRVALNAVFKYDYWTGVEVAFGFTALVVLAAFSWDYLERRRSRELQRLEPHDPQPSGRQPHVIDGESTRLR